jgi:S1-C subfamily serine protease
MMGEGWNAGSAGMTVAAGVRGVILAAAIVSAASFEARADQRRAPEALDYLATVLNGQTLGSAFMICDGVAVTNAHVVRPLRAGGTVSLFAPGGDHSTDARIDAVSERMDLALLSVKPGFLPVLPAASASASTGLRVTSAGVDAGAGGWPPQRLELAGTVLNPRSNVPAFGPGLVVRLPGVRSGFSGGPLLDTLGRLVGMITAIRPASHTSSAIRPAAGSRAEQARSAQSQAGEAFVLRARAIRQEIRRLRPGACR